MNGRERGSKTRTTVSSTDKEHRQMNPVSKRISPRRLGLLGATLAAIVALAGAMAAPAMADFGINDFDVTFTNQDGTPATQAGSHPYQLTASFGLNYSGPFFEELPDGELKDLITDLPAGFVGDPTSTPTCTTLDFLSPGPAELEPNCPNKAAVGMIAASIISPSLYLPYTIYSLESAPGAPARLATRVSGEPVVLDVGVNDDPPYNVRSSARNVSQIVRLFASQLVLWGNPNDSSHDPLRGTCLKRGSAGASFGGPAYVSLGTECPVENERKPFLTLPRSCSGPVASSYVADSWQEPGIFIGGSVFTHDDATPPNPQGFSGCGKLPFSPEIDAQPTSTSAETGSGLDFDLDFRQEGLTNENGLSQSDVKRAEVTLPEGVTINPSIGEGLGVCTPAGFERESLGSAPGEGCPNSSKIGTLHVDTPLLDEGIDGSVFLAQQDDPGTTEPGAENPFDSLIAMYLVLRNTDLGVFVKQAAEVAPDPATGRLVTTLDDIPQVPFSHFNFHFKEGTRAPLVTPNACGTYATKAVFTPWSDPDSPRTVFADFEITRGRDGGACPPEGVPPFQPRFEAGSLNNNAGSFSPFDMRITREDGEQDMTKFSATLPPGVVGSLAGVGKCGQYAVAVAKQKTGRQELADPSCPADSQIGNTLAGAGVGTALTYVPGKIYLAGPYNGDPLSVIAITPAIAGPFDAGTVAVRLALTLNPKTAEVEVDGANSDPIPHILQGIVLKLRDLRVNVDRPEFTLNPTSCDESSVKSVLFGSYLDVLNPADDVPVDLSTRYQAANCLNLGFSPKLGLRLKGKNTRRGGHPGLRAVYSPKAGDANVEDLVVRLPRSAFLDQSHIRTICTRVQFAADSCPKAAQYGYIRAWTPLLDEPLQGPVWLRSSNHKLPDLVFDLRGLVDVEVSTRLDSIRGGIRARVESAPDAPISRVILNMQGGKKGLIVNSRDLCKGKTARAAAQFDGHNGKRIVRRPVMRPQCGRKATRSSHRRGRVAGASAVR